jgi:hypothetical protein
VILKEKVNPEAEIGDFPAVRAPQTTTSMKPVLACLLLIAMVAFRPLAANATARVTPLPEELRDELKSLLTRKDLSFMDSEVAVISIEFLVNARNEVVILDVCGRDEKACAFIRNLLNYKTIKFTETKQLTPYTLDIRLVRTGRGERA